MQVNRHVIALVLLAGFAPALAHATTVTVDLNQLYPTQPGVGNPNDYLVLTNEGSSGPVSVNWSGAQFYESGYFGGGGYCTTNSCGVTLTAAAGYAITIDSVLFGRFDETGRGTSDPVNYALNGSAGMVDLASLNSTVVNFGANSGSSATLSFGNDSYANGFNLLTYSYELTAVPEPASLLLMVGGIAGLALVRRRAA